ncbi:MAG: TonB family protein [Terracidiphilus sp.]|jgi:TonB family protein
MMEFKGYFAGPIGFDAEDNTFSGVVAGLKDVIHFEGKTAKELTRAFRDSVESYIEFCAETPSRRGVRNRPVRRFVIVFGTLLVSHALFGQTNAGFKSVSEADARQHLTQKTDPVYPPIAAAARIEGDVVISVVVDMKGQVESEKVLSGPAMLQQATLDAVKKWQFAPFTTDGTEAPVTTTLTIPFHLEHHGPQPTAEQEKAAQALFPLSDKCREALRAQNTQDALNLCKQALDMSLKAGDLTNSDQLGRLDSHQLYGHALLIAGRAQDALEQVNLAVAEAKKCVTDKDEEYAEPFFWRAIVEAHLGDASDALSDFQTAETTMRRAITNLPDMKEHYSSYLAAILKQHAALLDLMGRQDEAAKLRDEAAAL